MIVSLAVALGLVTQDPSAGPPQQPPPPPFSAGDPTTLDEVVVERVGPREAARTFVETVAAAPRGARLARWAHPVCASVVGLRRPLAEAILDRIAEVAAGLEVGVAGRRCTPNVVIIATDDGRAMAEAVVARERERFRPQVGNSNLGLAALDRFRTSETPVRWWHTSAPVFDDSDQLAARYRGGVAPGADAVARGGYASETAVRNVSRMRSGVRHVLNSVTVIVDLDRASAVPLPALADLIAMLAVAQIDPEADFSGVDTVLNLFDPAAGVAGLTAWDEDYLTALYAARPDRANSRLQEGEVTSELVRNRRQRGEIEVTDPSADDDPGS